jgi:hypothetical protein
LEASVNATALAPELLNVTLPTKLFEVLFNVIVFAPAAKLDVPLAVNAADCEIAPDELTTRFWKEEAPVLKPTVPPVPPVVSSVTLETFALFAEVMPFTTIEVLLPAFKIRLPAVIFCKFAPVIDMVPAVAPKPILPAALIVVVLVPLFSEPVKVSVLAEIVIVPALSVVLFEIIDLPDATVTPPPIALKVIGSSLVDIF